MLKPSRPVTSVALAITPDLLFAVQVRNQDGHVEVLQSGAEPIPAGCFSAGAVTDPQQLGRTIRTFWNRLGLRERSAAVVLPSALCSLRAVRLPELPAPERRAVVRGELEHAGALPFQGGAFDFFWVEDTAQSEPALAEAFALYTSDDVVNGIRSVLRFADLRLTTLEPMSVGVLRASSLATPADAPTAVLCLDANSTDFCILENNRVRYLRRIPSGWSDLITRKAAETPEHRDFVSASADAVVPAVEPGAVAGSANGAADRAIISAPFLVTETVRSMAYYGRLRGASPMPAQLRVPADGADCEYLTRVIGEAPVPPLSAVDPLSAYGIATPVELSREPNTLPAQILAAIGTAAATAGVSGGIPQLDLAQDDPATRVVNPWASALPTALIGSAIWVVLTVVIWSALTANADRAASDQQLLSARAVDIRAQQAPLQLQQQLQDSTKGLRARSDLPVAALLGQIAAAFTKEISLHTLSVDVEGVVTLSGDGQTSEDVQRFAYALANGKTLREPRIDTLRQEALDRASFRIVGKIVPSAPEVKRPGGGA